MNKTTFLYPIADSGYCFEMELLGVKLELEKSEKYLKARFSLKNTNDAPFQIPIRIAHTAFLDCKLLSGFERDNSEKIYSDRVVDVGRKTVMFGYGDDHHVKFKPGEVKEFWSNQTMFKI
jgi:hypothetical protein